MKEYKNYNDKSSEVVEEIVEKPVEPKNRTGHITGCEILNVRQNPSISALIVGTLTSADTVIVQGDSNSDFFKVTTPKGVSGFCMKKYIAFYD